MIFDYISLSVFLVSFSIGLFFVYIYGSEKKTIYVYPTPENVYKIIYKDKADNCFAYNQVEVECPKDSSLISFIPVQS